MTLTIECPAKVNLFLSVGSVDHRGYHPIRTVFQAVSLTDTLTLEISQSDSFECECKEVPIENTVTKAWRLVREYVKLPALTVRLEKRIPVKSGLGGGSSDAAGFLRGLTKLTRGGFGQPEAVEVGRAVGADVPFFLVGGRAHGEGYGDQVTPESDAPTSEVLIIMPDCEVSTAQAYAGLDSLPRILRPFSSEVGHNDFESVAPEGTMRALEFLRSNGLTAGVTGSGAAVFGMIEPGSDPGTLSQSVRELRLGTPYACKTLTREESLWMS